MHVALSALLRGIRILLWAVTPTAISRECSELVLGRTAGSLLTDNPLDESPDRVPLISYPIFCSPARINADGLRFLCDTQATIQVNCSSVNFPKEPGSCRLSAANTMARLSSTYAKASRLARDCLAAFLTGAAGLWCFPAHRPSVDRGRGPSRHFRVRATTQCPVPQLLSLMTKT